MGRLTSLKERELTRNEKFLIYLVEQNAKTKYEMTDEIRARIKEELRVIIGAGFCDYFLITWDIMNYCRQKGIAIGRGRGSAGGSVVAYLLGITRIDPIKFGLIFERFLNDERVAMPDIDSDICWSRRQEVLQYVADKYGEDKVGQIVTFGTLSVKSLLDDMGRVFKIPKKDIDELKDLVGDAEKPTLKMMVAENHAFMEKLHKVGAKDDRFIPALYRLEGNNRHSSVHSGGVIISNKPLTDIAPIYKPKDALRQVVQYEMFDAEDIGLLKMDLLGLRTVTLIDWACKYVKEKIDPTFDIEQITQDDQATFDIINRGDTAGIFQLEGTGITKFAQELHVESFNDVIALLALFRPSTLDSGSAQQYIDRKNGKEPVSYPHPDLETALGDTYGIILYQEQVMKILQIMGGFSLGQADVARKAMGKKKKELMDAELEKFRAGAIERGYDTQTIETVSHLIETFARYGFNKSHAVAYAHLTYDTAYLKARYPSAFFTAWLNVTDAQDKRGWIIDHAVRAKVKVLPPDINKSAEQFTMVDDQTIMFGLSSVKGCGQSVVSKVMASREAQGEFSSYFDFCKRMTGIAKDKKEALVGAGMFDFDKRYHRGFIYKYARMISDGAKTYTGPEEDYYKGLPEVDLLSSIELGKLEYQYLAFYISEDPLRLAQERIRNMGGVVNANLKGKDRISIGGRVGRVHVIKTKKGDDMAFVDIDDGHQVYSVTLFASQYRKYAHMLHSKADHGHNEDVMVLVNCDVSIYRGKESLSARSLVPIDMTNNVYDIEVRMKKPNRLQTIEIYHLLKQASAGESRLVLKIHHKGYEIKALSRMFHVDATDILLTKLEGIVGQGNAKRIIRRYEG